MGDNVANLSERIKPLRITINKTGEQYELDFNRESIMFAESRGFDPDDISKYPMTKIPEFWWYAFRKNHRRLAKAQTDAILDSLGGVTTKIMERLILLYNQAQTSNNIVQDEEDLAKNGSVLVELD